VKEPGSMVFLVSNAGNMIANSSANYQIVIGERNAVDLKDVLAQFQIEE